MEKFIKSVNRLYLAASLLSLQQAGSALSPDLTASSDLNQMKDDIERLINNTLALFTPRGIFRIGLKLLQQSADTLRRINPQSDHLAWHELQNKLQTYSLFEQVDSILNLSPARSYLLLELAERASRLDRYEAVWVLEGLGHYYSDLHIGRGIAPEAILSGSQLPSASLVPLHAGMGLSLAEWMLPDIERQTAQSLSAFIELCRANSHPGYFGAVFESLGLATRNLYPHLLMSIDQSLRRINPELIGYFWHGVGRAVYFSPTNFLPWRAAPWQGLEMCFRESTHDLGRRNIIAGFCWALTLVNIRQPEVLAAFLKYHEDQIEENDACANGIGSALLIWLDSASQDGYFSALHQYRPAPALAALWNRHVLTSCQKAREYHRTSSRDSPGETFRYREWS